MQCPLLQLTLFAAYSICAPAWSTTTGGAELASACTACHGTAGRSQGAIPSLAGMSAAEFIDRMDDFRWHDGSMMTRIVRGYDDDEVATLARYFAAQPAAHATAQPPCRNDAQPHQ